MTNLSELCYPKLKIEMAAYKVCLVVILSLIERAVDSIIEAI